MEIKHKLKILSLAVLSVLYANTTYALTLTDSDFPTTNVSANSDDVTINISTDGNIVPHIDTTSGAGLAVNNNKQLIVNGSKTFGIKSTVSGNYNSFYGIHSLNGGTLIANTDIKVNYNSGIGVYIANMGSVLFNNKLYLESTGQSIGIKGYSSSTVGSDSRFKDEVTIISHGNDSYGIVSQSMNPNGASPSLVFDKKVSIAMNGNDSVGVMVQDATSGVVNSGLLHFKDGLDVDMIDGTAVLSSQINHKIQIDGEINLVSQNKTYNVLESQSGHIELNGKATLDGNVEAIDSGVIDLNLSANSRLNSSMNNYVTSPPAGSSGGEINVNFIGAGSSWTLTDSSSISSLSGQGHIKLSTDIDNHTGMILSITETNGASGNHTVEVVDSGTAAGLAESYKQVIIETNGGTAKFSMPNLANIGAYQYDIEQSGDNWQLFRTRALSLTTNNAINGLRAGYLMNYNENQSLLQRMGELRRYPSEGDLWVKILAGKNKVNSNSQLSGFNQKFYGLQLGADKKYSLTETTDFYLGLAFGYTRSDQDYARGDGNINSYYLNVYGTYTNENGLYLDNVLKLGWQKQDFNLRDNQNKSVKGDTESNIIGLSSELGYKYYVADNQKTGWFVEPSAQLSYSQVASDRFTASNNQKINFDSYTSVLGKIGFVMGYDFAKEAMPTNLYFKTNYFHEFAGDLKGKINDETIKTNLGSNWWSYGVGFNTQIEQSQHLYFDIEQSRGADFKQLWKLNVGYRYLW